jgi:hypothetical protein
VWNFPKEIEPMTSTKTLSAAVAAMSFAGVCLTAFSPSAYALDPGLGVGRPGLGVYRHAPVARAAVVTPGAPVAAAAVATPGTVAVLPAGCTVVVVNGVRVHRCGTVVYRPVVQAGRTVYVVVR